ncbi:hypothetical protein [Paenibacillus jiagnxiensis]
MRFSVKPLGLQLKVFVTSHMKWWITYSSECNNQDTKNWQYLLEG